MKGEQRQALDAEWREGAYVFADRNRQLWLANLHRDLEWECAIEVVEVRPSATIYNWRVSTDASFPTGPKSFLVEFNGVLHSDECPYGLADAQKACYDVISEWERLHWVDATWREGMAA